MSNSSEQQDQPRQQDQPKQTDQPRDPRAGYHSGPFPEQVQKQPGLTAPMEPKPDHGEESYRGSGALSGKAALITGGDSGIGKAVAIAFAREGADVAISYLPEEDEDAQDTAEWIRKAGRKALLLPGDGRSEDFAAHIVEATLAEFGGLDVLVLMRPTRRTVTAWKRCPPKSSTASSKPICTPFSGPPAPPSRT